MAYGLSMFIVHINVHTHIHIYIYTPRIPENDGFISEQAHLGGIGVYQCCPFRKKVEGPVWHTMYCI